MEIRVTGSAVGLTVGVGEVVAVWQLAGWQAAALLGLFVWWMITER